MALVTTANKNNIDLALTAFITGAVLWFLYKRNNGKLTRIEWIMVACAAVLAYIIVSQVTTNAVDQGALPDDVVLPPDPLGTDPDFSPTGYTNNLKTFIDQPAIPWSEDYYVGAINDANNLSNTELAAVYNDWKNRYYTEYDNQSLTAALENTTIYWWVANGSEAGPARDLLISRLQSNGLV